MISFSGKAYNKDTLEEVDQGSDSDSEDEDEDEDDTISVNENGAEIPKETTEWFTGRYVILQRLTDLKT